MSHHAECLKGSAWRQKTSERQYLPGNRGLVLPKLHFPAGTAAYTLLKMGLSPVQNEDFVWHLVLGTLLTIFFGTRPAGQVHRSVAHTETLTAPSASSSRRLPTLSRQAGHPERSLLLFSLVVMRKTGFQLARVNSHSTVMKAPLPPPPSSYVIRPNHSHT